MSSFSMANLKYHWAGLNDEKHLLLCPLSIQDSLNPSLTVVENNLWYLMHRKFPWLFTHYLTHLWCVWALWRMYCVLSQPCTHTFTYFTLQLPRYNMVCKYTDLSHVVHIFVFYGCNSQDPHHGVRRDPQYHRLCWWTSTAVLLFWLCLLPFV